MVGGVGADISIRAMIFEFLIKIIQTFVKVCLTVFFSFDKAFQFISKIGRNNISVLISLVKLRELSEKSL